ncbi:hypothetical protein GCM10018793_61270 [Streptomyces sulfonofaciens]|uniref:Uncharacterized protein n=1 Tax=Streptomyces sulfonofaciens TaxID=68272 RepID=A0A919L7S9_9ACTN|nr:hypothetical protein GCM10018793_61270 [Streptomyces sulfonofaciens]
MTTAVRIGRAPGAEPDPGAGTVAVEAVEAVGAVDVAEVGADVGVGVSVVCMTGSLQLEGRFKSSA